VAARDSDGVLYNSAVDSRALGVTAYMLLSGRRPFASKHPKEKQKLICNHEPTFEGGWGGTQKGPHQRHPVHWSPLMSPLNASPPIVAIAVRPSGRAWERISPEAMCVCRALLRKDPRERLSCKV